MLTVLQTNFDITDDYVKTILFTSVIGTIILYLVIKLIVWLVKKIIDKIPPSEIKRPKRKKK
jgi:large-conductance mechanosensitive channel